VALHQLIYASRTNALTADNIQSILNEARAVNAKNHVTGMLLFSNGYFLQLLEGERHIVSGTMLRIARDPRHYDIDIIHAGPITSRNFADWSMLYAPAYGKETSIYKPYMGSGEFEPFKLTAEATVELCKDFSKACCEKANKDH
jgi:hypothetical protein